MRSGGWGGRRIAKMDRRREKGGLEVEILGEGGKKGGGVGRGKENVVLKG